jgi:HAD superfamily hydrolase (TIGR01549 family)
VIKAVIFDFDGVLAESVNIKTEAFRSLFEPEGPDIAKEVVAYHLENAGVSRFEKFRYIYKEILKRPLGDEEFESLCRRFEKLVLDAVIAAPEVGGATECLRGLYGKARLFIVSGTPQEEIRLIAKVREMEHYFEGIYGSPQTKTELVNIILRERGLIPDEVVFVGDAMTDYRAAMETGTGFIARMTPETGEHWRGLGVKAISDMAGCIKELGI